MEFDENLAAVHAYLCADGYVIKNPLTQKQKYYVLGFRNTNLVLLKDFQDRFEKVFRIKPHLIEGQRCRLGSKPLYELMTKEFGSFYSWKWRMPELNEELTRVWLRSYFDCEGWVTCKRHQNRMIGIDCVNEIGLKQIGDALKKLKIANKIKKRNTRNIFSMFIFGKENLIKFYEKVGFLHPEKSSKLKEALNDFVVYKWEFPTENEELNKFVEDILKTKAKVKKASGTLRIISNKEENLLRLREELKRLFKIDPKVNRLKNGIGTIYFELNVNKQAQVKYLIDKNLINKEEKIKWIQSKSRK